MACTLGGPTDLRLRLSWGIIVKRLGLGLGLGLGTRDGNWEWENGNGK